MGVDRFAQLLWLYFARCEKGDAAGAVELFVGGAQQRAVDLPQAGRGPSDINADRMVRVEGVQGICETDRFDVVREQLDLAHDDAPFPLDSFLGQMEFEGKMHEQFDAGRKAFRTGDGKRGLRQTGLRIDFGAEGCKPRGDITLLLFEQTVLQKVGNTRGKLPGQTVDCTVLDREQNVGLLRLGSGVDVHGDRAAASSRKHALADVGVVDFLQGQGHGVSAQLQDGSFLLPRKKVVSRAVFRAMQATSSGTTDRSCSPRLAGIVHTPAIRRWK